MKLRTLALLGAGSALMLPAFVSAQGLNFFNNQQSFRSGMGGAKVLKGIEDFEEAVIQPGQILAENDPLNFATVSAMFPNGLTQDNIQVQSNLGGANSGVLNPRGAGALAVSNNTFGYPSKWVVANFFVDSLDLIFLDETKTAVGGNLISITTASQVRMDVYGLGNVFLGTNAINVAAPGQFWGVVSAVPITRINIFSLANQAEGMDDIEMWTVVPEPGSMIALAVGTLALLRRRRSK